MNSSYWSRLFEKIGNIITALGGGQPVVNDDYSDVYSSFWLKLFQKLDEVIAAILQGGSGGDYENLSNKPAIDEKTLTKDSTAAGLGLETAAAAGNNADLKTAEKNTLVGAINEVAASVSAKVDKLSGVTDCDLIYAKRADGTQGYQELWTEPEANSIPSRDDYGVLYAQPGDSDKAVVVNEQLKAAMLSTHKWLPAVGTKAELPDHSTLDPNINYLCRVINDTDAPANNGVWELIAGAEEWTYFSDNLDFVDERELNLALVGKVDKSGGSMTGDLVMSGKDILDINRIDAGEIRSETGIEGDSINVKGPLVMNGYKVEGIPIPVADTEAASKKYVDDIAAAKQDKTLPYKGANNQAGILVDLGVEAAGGAEVLFDILYNETQSGNLKRQAHIHGQFYGDMSARNGMVQNGNVSVPVYIFKGTVEGVGNTHTYIWIPNSAAAYFPSAKVEAWGKIGTGLFDSMSPTITTLADAPAETLVPIALFFPAPA